MRTITWTVPGQPVGKARPRFARIGAFVRTYTPKATATYENLIKLSYLDAAGPASNPSTGWVRLSIQAVFARPASHYGTGRNAGRLKPGAPVCYTQKPDCDNLLKAVLDALNGVAYADDRQVHGAIVGKSWGAAGELRCELVRGD